MNVLFLCPHGAAKSSIATALARDLAERENLDIVCSNAGTDPDACVNPIAVSALRQRGLEHSDPPRLVRAGMIHGADVVVSFGCMVADLPVPPGEWIDWSDAPDASADVDGLSAFIELRMPWLLKTQRTTSP